MPLSRFYMTFIKLMIRTLFASIIIFSLFSFCSHEKAPEAKDIDYVSIPYLSNVEMRALKTHLNDQHIEEAHKSPLKTPIKDKQSFYEKQKEICRMAHLTKIESNELYAVARLTYSLPYVHESAAEFLDLLGERMEARFKEKGIQHYRFVLTSVLRTQKDQALLQKVNANATPQETSHYFGTTFDISQTRFQMNNNENKYSYRLRNILARELIRLQEEGKCYVILESREKCFHVTVKL